MIFTLGASIAPLHNEEGFRRSGLFFFEILGQSSFACLAVKGGKIVSCLTHYFDYLVIRNTMIAVGKRCIDIGIQSTGCGMGIPLDAGNLNHPAYMPK